MNSKNTTNRSAIMVPWIILLFFVILGMAPLVPPLPSENRDSTDFSVNKAFEHIKLFALEPRPIGSPASEKARDYIIKQLQLMNLEPEVQIIEAYNYYAGTAEVVEVVNVAARIPGSAPTTAVAIVGHYDTIPTSPGANDDASAIAIMLETARAILDGDRLQNDVIFVFTDGEEPAPRFGSSAFVETHHWAGDIGFVINLETIGTGGSSTLVEMNGPGKWIVDQYAKGVPNPVAFSFLTAISDLIGGSNTDFSEFRDVGIPGVGMAYLHGSTIYHTSADIPERVSLRSLQQQGANTLALTRTIGNIDFSSTINYPDAVFFTVGRFYVVRYPAAWALPLVLLTGALLISSVVRLMENRIRFLKSIGAILVTLIVATVAAFGIWSLIAGQRNMMGISESYLYLTGLSALTGAIGILMARWTRRQIGTQPDASGVVFVWCIFGLLITMASPGLSYLFVLPSLAGSLALLIRSSKSAKQMNKVAGFVLVTGTALLLAIPAIDFLFQLAQPRSGNLDSQILFVVAFPVLLIYLIFEIIRAFWVPQENPLSLMQQEN